MALHIPDTFKDFLKLLENHRVEYLLIGGYAVAYHGYPRATADMDIFIAVSRENAERMVAVLREFGFNIPELSEDLFSTDIHKILRLGVPPLRIEIMMSISGVEFSDCYEKRVEFKEGELTIKIIDKASLKQNKAAAARHKDLNDLENL